MRPILYFLEQSSLRNNLVNDEWETSTEYPAIYVEEIVDIISTILLQNAKIEISIARAEGVPRACVNERNEITELKSKYYLGMQTYTGTFSSL